MKYLKIMGYGVFTALAFFGFISVVSDTVETNRKPAVVESIVKITDEEETGGGTGFVVKLNGDQTAIVSNEHVCGDADIVYIHDDKGNKTPRAVIKTDRTHDLCLIGGIDAPALDLAVKQPVRFQPLRIMGHPFLKPLAPTNGVFTGRVLGKFLEAPTQNGDCNSGAKKTQIDTLFGPMLACVRTEDLRTTTIPIGPGNSGSPVLNNAGEVVGVANSSAGDGQANFIPLEYLREFLEN